jgi:formate/nitrite transporter FocA (FNT family)
VKRAEASSSLMYVTIPVWRSDLNGRPLWSSLLFKNFGNFVGAFDAFVEAVEITFDELCSKF